MLVKVRRGIRDNFFQFLKKVGANSGRAPVREISSVYRCRHTDLHVGIAKRNNDRRFIARQHILESGHIITHILYLGPVPEARARSPGVLCTSVNNCFEVLARTLIALDNLGQVLEKQGKNAQAEALIRRALTAREKVLGRRDPDTLVSINNLAIVLNNLGKHADAEAMHRQALAIKIDIFSPDYPETLASINNLGLVLNSQGKWGEAKRILRQVIVIKKKVFGLEHHSALKSVDNLGLVCGSQGKNNEAEIFH